MKHHHALAVGTALLLASGAAYAASGSVMNGGPGGEGWMSSNGGVWVPLLFAVVVFGLLMWDLSQMASERLQETEREQ
jgi:hypothetical protein